ncbi:transposase [Streptomyces sp. NPDC002394]
MLPDREAETLVAWLREHPGGEIVCRDRAAFFADGARTGAPQAQRCADESHVWRNLGEAVERLVSRLRALLRDLVEPEPSPRTRTRTRTGARADPSRPAAPRPTCRGSSSTGSATPTPRSAPRSSRA